jgi:hypothetical protein
MAQSIAASNDSVALMQTRLQELLHNIQFGLRFRRPHRCDVEQAIDLLRNLGLGVDAERLEREYRVVLQGRKPTPELIDFVQRLHAACVLGFEPEQKAIDAATEDQDIGEFANVADGKDAVKRDSPPEVISDEEADLVARKLAEKNRHFVTGAAHEWAASIQRRAKKRCSPTKVKGLPFWEEEMKRQGRGRSKIRGPRREGSRSVGRPISFSPSMEVCHKDHMADDPTKKLVDEEDKNTALEKVRWYFRKGWIPNDVHGALTEQLKRGDLKPRDAIDCLEQITATRGG